MQVISIPTCNNYWQNLQLMKRARIQWYLISMNVYKTLHWPSLMVHILRYTCIKCFNVSSLFEIDPVVLEENDKNLFNLFSTCTFSNLFLWEMGLVLHLIKLELPWPRDVMCQMCIHGPVVWRRWKYEKLTKCETDRYTYMDKDKMW